MRRVAPELQAALDRLAEAVADETSRQADREAGIIVRRERGCAINRQQDEFVCSTCRMRWDVHEEPACPRG